MRIAIPVVLGLVLSLAACTADGDTSDFTDDTDVVDTDTGDTDTDTGETDTDTGETDTDTGDTGPDPVAEMCAEWGTRRANRTEGLWSGNVATCDPGTLDATGRQNILDAVNAHRWLAGQSDVAQDARLNAMAQECSLMMRANSRLSHNPGTDWACYSTDGADSAGSSNISTAQGVLSVDMYMVDFGAGNQASLGHRRWILANGLGPIGVASTDRHSCLQVIGGSGPDEKDWVAWPPEGLIPMDVFDAVFGENVDDTGWSIQSDTIALNGATVTVTRDGLDLAVDTRDLLQWYGSRWAIAFRPNGWSTVPGTYEISVDNISAPFDYTVEVVDCDG